MVEQADILSHFHIRQSCSNFNKTHIQLFSAAGRYLRTASATH